jgi:hypothetical protein
MRTEKLLQTESALIADVLMRATGRFGQVQTEDGDFFKIIA